MDRDVQIISKYETSMKIAGNFLSVFLSKCGSKNEEIDYRPLFENFVQDLLTTVNKPEWPAAEVLLSLLGKLLVIILFCTKKLFPQFVFKKFVLKIFFLGEQFYEQRHGYGLKSGLIRLSRCSCC